MDLSFAVQKLAKFSENSGKVYFEVLIHLLRYIRDNKTLGLKYYADLNDSPVTDILRQSNIKTKNHLMAFYDYSLKYCPDTGRSTGVYIILLTYIRDNNTLGLKYYADLNDTPVTDLLIQSNIKTKNHLMDFSDYSW